jgi:hypothetical protein
MEFILKCNVFMSGISLPSTSENDLDFSVGVRLDLRWAGQNRFFTFFPKKLFYEIVIYKGSEREKM